MTDRTIIGFIGPVLPDQARAEWNAYFRQQGSPLEFQFYRTKTREELELRLSEMFVHGRRGYVVHPVFSATVIPLLDRLNASSEQAQKVDTIVNEDGRLCGYFLHADPSGAQEERTRLWGDARQPHVA